MGTSDPSLLLALSFLVHHQPFVTPQQEISARAVRPVTTDCEQGHRR